MRMLLMACAAVSAVCYLGCSRGAPDAADETDAVASSGKAIELNDMDVKAQTAQGVVLVWRVAGDVVQIGGLDRAFRPGVEDDDIRIAARLQRTFARVQAENARWVGRGQLHQL